MKMVLVYCLSILLICFMAEYSLVRSEEKAEKCQHEDHMEDLVCTDCHTSAKTAARAGFPNEALCHDCHDESMKKFLVGLADRKPTIPVAFSHKNHGILNCSDCHGDPSHPTPLKSPPSACFECHRNKNKILSCQKCHEKTNFIPSYHENRWEKRHGILSTAQHTQKHGYNCSECHSESSCQSCHQQTKPSDHNGFYRIRGHGLSASMKRERCATCHEESYCIRCHQTTKPINHVGQWSIIHGKALSGGKDGPIGKCSVCHTESWCAACHNQNRR